MNKKKIIFALIVGILIGLLVENNFIRISYDEAFNILKNSKPNKIIGKRTNKIGQSRLFAKLNKSNFKFKWIVLQTTTLKKFISQVKKN